MWKSIARGTGVGMVVGLMIGCAIAGGLGAIAGAGVGAPLGFAIMSALALGGAFSDRYPARARRVEFDCPHSHRHVNASLLENADTSKVFEVEACSVFTNPKQIRCKKACIEDLNAGLSATPAKA